MILVISETSNKKGREVKKSQQRGISTKDNWIMITQKSILRGTDRVRYGNGVHSTLARLCQLPQGEITIEQRGRIADDHYPLQRHVNDALFECLAIGRPQRRWVAKRRYREHTFDTTRWVIVPRSSVPFWLISFIKSAEQQSSGLSPDKITALRVRWSMLAATRLGCGWQTLLIRRASWNHEQTPSIFRPNEIFFEFFAYIHDLMTYIFWRICISLCSRSISD